MFNYIYGSIIFLMESASLPEIQRQVPKPTTLFESISHPAGGSRVSKHSTGSYRYRGVARRRIQ